MLTAFGIENYKSFPCASLEIKPITILLGTNSVGKSSILHLLLALQQTNLYGSFNYVSALKLNDKMTSLGEVDALFPNGNTKFPIVLSFHIQGRLLEFTLTSRLQNEFDAFLTELRRQMFSVLDLGKKLVGLDLPDSLKEQHLNSGELFDSVMAAWKLIKSDKRLEDVFSSAQFTSSQRKRRRSFGYSEPDLTHTYKLLAALRAKRAGGHPVALKIALVPSSDNKALRVKEFTVSWGDDKIISVSYGLLLDEIEDLSSDFFEKGQLHNYRSSLSKILQPTKPLFHFADDRDRDPIQIYFTQVCAEIMNTSLYALRTEFTEDALLHIGPLRASPKRFYFIDRANTEMTPGISFVEILREAPEILNQVNEWLARFSIKLHISHLAEVLQRLHVKESGLSIDLDITDVGFGISQVLPVIVKGFLAPADSLTLIEQPEVHLHPKMQADLADLFIQMSGVAQPMQPASRVKHFIIETHSEYLLKRLRRRIAEKVINPEDVAIYFLSKTQEGESQLKRVSVDASGDFAWPLDFYESDLEDTLAYLSASVETS